MPSLPSSSQSSLHSSTSKPPSITAPPTTTSGSASPLRPTPSRQPTLSLSTDYAGEDEGKPVSSEMQGIATPSSSVSLVSMASEERQQQLDSQDQQDINQDQSSYLAGGSTLKPPNPLLNRPSSSRSTSGSALAPRSRAASIASQRSTTGSNLSPGSQRTMKPPMSLAPKLTREESTGISSPSSFTFGSEIGSDVAGILSDTIGKENDARKGLRRLVNISQAEERIDLEDEARDRSIQGGRSYGKGKGKGRDQEVVTLQSDQSGQEISSRTYPVRKYYVLTNAGKPVFESTISEQGPSFNPSANPADGVPDKSNVATVDSPDVKDNTTNLMGVVQALVSIFAEDDGDKIKTIKRGKIKISFLIRTPLYLFCVSEWGEPDYVLRTHLEYLYLQMLSVVTNSQLQKVFLRRSNFDLRRLLEGTEPFLKNLIVDLQSDFTYLTSTLQPLRMTPALRDAAAGALVPPGRIKDLLYVLLIADGKIVTLLRPRKHSIHPSDLHLLLNILQTSPTLRTQESWLPICLPKFNPEGFVYAFISYVRPQVGMIFVSADRDGFGELREWKESVVEKLDAEKTLLKIEDAIKGHDYSATDIGFPGLLHFWYKSRKNVQITTPTWDAPYSESEIDKNSLITLYQQLYDAIHAKSGQSSHMKLFYIKGEHEACLGWITQPFELYLAISPNLPKSAAVGAANAIARWIVKEDSRVFLKEAPVF